MKRLSKDDLDYIRWRIWEPLRRNLEYRTDFEKLKETIKKDVYFIDPEKLGHFCEKWKLPYAVDPALGFDQLLNINDKDTEQQKGRRIQHLFADLYHPESDSAAFVNLLDCIHGNYLQVYIDLEKSKNQIEAEFEKILNEWLSKDRLKYHGIVKEKQARLHRGEKWKSRFQVFDMWEKSKSFSEIATALKTPIDTVYKHYLAAWQAVNPGKERRSLDSAHLKTIFPCTSCHKFAQCKKTCERVEVFLKRHTHIKVKEKKVKATQEIDKFTDEYAVKRYTLKGRTKKKNKTL